MWGGGGGARRVFPRTNVVPIVRGGGGSSSGPRRCCEPCPLVPPAQCRAPKDRFASPLHRSSGTGLGIGLRRKCGPSEASGARGNRPPKTDRVGPWHDASGPHRRRTRARDPPPQKAQGAGPGTGGCTRRRGVRRGGGWDGGHTAHVPRHREPERRGRVRHGVVRLRDFAVHLGGLQRDLVPAQFGGGGFGTRPRCLFVCLWRRLLASRHRTF